MASLIPLIHDILPMIMPSSVHIVKGENVFRWPGKADAKADEHSAVEQAGARNDALETNAVVNKSPRMCASGTRRLPAHPQSSHSFLGDRSLVPPRYMKNILINIITDEQPWW